MQQCPLSFKKYDRITLTLHARCVNGHASNAKDTLKSWKSLFHIRTHLNPPVEGQHIFFFSPNKNIFPFLWKALQHVPDPMGMSVYWKQQSGLQYRSFTTVSSQSLEWTNDALCSPSRAPILNETLCCSHVTSGLGFEVFLKNINWKNLLLMHSFKLFLIRKRKIQCRYEMSVNERLFVCLPLWLQWSGFLSRVSPYVHPTFIMGVRWSSYKYKQHKSSQNVHTTSPLSLMAWKEGKAEWTAIFRA